MGFQDHAVWLKASFVLITIGFAVWLSAIGVSDVEESNLSTIATFGDVSRYRAYIAFLIIGVITYYGAVLLNFLCIFVPDTENHSIVIIVGAILAILAGISGIIVSAIASAVPFSDRIAWALICAFVSAAFLLMTLCCAGRSTGGGGGGGGASSNSHTSDFQPQQQIPA